MFRSPKLLYTLIILTLILILSGCALQRTDDDAAAEPLSNGLPPTLAPLGSDSAEVAEDVAANPTALNVDATATTSAGQAAAVGTEAAVPTNQPAVQLSSDVVANENAEQAAVEPETFTPPAEQASTTQPLIVDAPAEELPTGGPIAANPPASQTTGEYAAPIPGSGAAYIVEPGDTLFGLALAYGTSVQALMQANNLTSETIYQGQELVIPGYDGSYSIPSGPAYPADYPSGDGEYIVAPGETLFSIAARYGTSVEALAIANGLSQPYIIYAGQPLTIVTMPEGYAPDSYDYQQDSYGYQQEPYGYSEEGYGQNVAPGYGTHSVAPGETLYSIARQYGVTTQALAAANGLYNVNQIQAGQLLTIPAPY